MQPTGRGAAMAAAGGHLGPPNVLSIVWEDASIAAWDAFGVLIEMPNLKRLTARGLRYSQWLTSLPTGPRSMTWRPATPGKAAELASLWDAAMAGRDADSPPGVPRRVHRGTAGSGRAAARR
jgi:hypothetical protein